MEDLEGRLRFYAEEVCAVAGLESAALVEAFFRVARERFLGPGPWSVAIFEGPARGPYRVTADANPAHLYHNVAVAIDPVWVLNNGHPSSLALWIDALAASSTDRVSPEQPSRTTASTKAENEGESATASPSAIWAGPPVARPSPSAAVDGRDRAYMLPRSG